MIRFDCPRCSKSIAVGSEHAGKRGKCPGCGEVLIIPTAALDDVTDQAEWYYQIMGETVGPIAFTKLREAVDSRTVARDTFVRRAANGEWAAAEQVSGLFDEIPRQPKTNAVDPISNDEDFGELISEELATAPIEDATPKHKVSVGEGRHGPFCDKTPPKLSALSGPQLKMARLCCVAFLILAMSIVAAIVVRQNAELDRELDQIEHRHKQEFDRQTKRHIETYEELGIPRQCPHCRERIMWGATKCRYCQSNLKPTENYRD